MKRSRRAWLLVGIGAVAVGAAVFALSRPRIPPAESLPPLAVTDPGFGPTMEAHTGSPVVGGNAIHVLLDALGTLSMPDTYVTAIRR